MRGYHAEGEAVGEHLETLARLAVDAGLPADEVDDVLAGDRYADDVREDERLASTLGISGVPFFVADRAFAASGRPVAGGPRRAAAARLRSGARARLSERGARFRRRVACAQARRS